MSPSIHILLYPIPLPFPSPTPLQITTGAPSSFSTLPLTYTHFRLSNSNAKFWYQDTQAGSKSCTLLPEKYRRLFSNKQIVCIEYMDINDRDEREIFQRVQLGMALTPAEKLAVIKSPRADFIRHLQLTFFKDSSSSLTTLAWDRSRGTDFRCLATILWCLDRFQQSPSLLANTGSIVQVESWLSAKQQSPSSQFKSDVTAGFSFLEAMLNSSDSTITSPFHAYDSGKASRKVQKVSPIEFICISLLVLIWHTKLSAKAIADAITCMRKAVRDEHVDVRMNTRVGGTMITFIKELAVIEPEPENEHEHEQEQDDPEARNRRYKSRSRSSKVMEASPTVQSCTTRKRKRGGGEGEDPDVLSSSSTTGRLAEIRKVTQKYQESTVD